MATKLPLPRTITLKDVVLSFGTDPTAPDFARHVSQVEFTPSTSQVSWQGMSPDATVTDVTSATWVCALAYAQDWDSVESLSQYLYDNEGETVAATFEPKRGGRAWTADLVIVPGSIGGTVGAIAVGSVTLGVKGRPELGAVVAPAGA